MIQIMSGSQSRYYTHTTSTVSAHRVLLFQHSNGADYLSYGKFTGSWRIIPPDTVVDTKIMVDPVSWVTILLEVHAVPN